MGKYNDRLKQLQNDRRLHKQVFDSTMNRWAHLMDDNAKMLNTTHFNIEDEYYARQIAEIESKAKEEMIHEMTAEVLKRIDIQVKDNATPALKDLQKELSKLFK